MNDTINSDDTIRTDAAAGNTGVAANERQWASGAHLAALVAAFLTSWFAGVAGAIGALVVWMLVRDKSAFAAAHAKEALNFNLSMFLYAVLGILLTVFTLGLGLLVTVPLGIVLALAWVVFTLIAAFRAYDGKDYRYPLTIRLF